MDQDKMIIASILAVVVAISGFLIRHYFKEEKEEKPSKNR
jgi:Na+-transporting methylmalonyl-CoA/oxaloacetate decarboxylase gamma subunit